MTASLLPVGGLRDRPRPPAEAGSVAAAATALSGGGVVVFPTETFYALGADPRSTAGVEAVYRWKARPRDRPLPWVAASREQVESVCLLPPAAAALARRAWPGPVTLVLSLRRLEGSVAVRVSSHPVARALARALGRPVISTSANRSGHAPAVTAEGAVRGLVEAAPPGASLLCLDGGATPGGAPSVILDARSEPLRLLRGTLPEPLRGISAASRPDRGAAPTRAARGSIVRGP